MAGYVNSSKQDLYLEELFGMMYFFNETYESSYNIPVPIRKWFVERYLKQKELENKKNNNQPDVNQPLNKQQKESIKNRLKNNK